jgi:hypothetical protein
VVVVGLLVPLTAVLVVVAGEAVVALPVPLTAVLVVDGVVVVAVLVSVLGAVVVVVGVVLVALGAVALVTGLLVPLAAVPEPLTVDALTVVDPDVLTFPDPLLVAPTVVDPEALVVVVAVVGLVLPFVLTLLSSTGAAVPLAAMPEPLTVDALTVVEPAAFTSPEPLLVALTVVEPAAFVTVFCANVGVPSARPSNAVPTAVAIVLL